MIRIAKYLAHLGYGSRREIEKMVDDAKIKVNGIVIKDKGHKIQESEDVIEVAGKQVVSIESLVYYALHKPVGILSTTRDENGRKTVVDLVNSKIRVYPVGRLDRDSSGLILLTNDGELTHKLTHPKFHVVKRYKVCVRGEVDVKKVERLSRGVLLTDGKTAPCEVKVLKRMRLRSWIEFKLKEGRYRQIRRMCGKVGLEVLELIRMDFGPIGLGELGEGQARKLTEGEVEELRRAVGGGQIPKS